MNLRRIAALLALIALAVIPAHSASYRVQTFTLWNGATFDSTRHVKWIPVQGANHIVLRSWSTKAAFSASTDADSTFSDSIATWVALFSDSVSFMARDSAGVVVTSSSTIPRESAHGDPYPICADSVALTPTTAAQTVVDSVITQTGLDNASVNTPLRAPGVGSGFITRIFALVPGGSAVYGDGEIGKRYMGIALTPLRRLTVTGFSSTQGKRVNGLKGFRMEATVYYQDER